MKKRILSIVLTLCMVLMLVPTTAFAEGITPATPQTDTDGVYQIGTAEELYGFAQLVNNGNTSASAVLTADITVNSNLPIHTPAVLTDRVTQSAACISTIQTQALSVCSETSVQAAKSKM